MKRLKRLFYLTLFNILVSATTTLAVIYAWDLGKEKLAEMQRLAELTPATPAVTVIVVNAGSEATAVIETLGIPAAPTDTLTPAPPTPPSQSCRVQEGYARHRGGPLRRYATGYPGNQQPGIPTTYIGQEIYIRRASPTLTRQHPNHHRHADLHPTHARPAAQRHAD
jgi:hypothetical protein